MYSSSYTDIHGFIDATFNVFVNALLKPVPFEGVSCPALFCGCGSFKRSDHSGLMTKVCDRVKLVHIATSLWHYGTTRISIAFFD